MPNIIDDPFFIEKLPTFLDLIRTSAEEGLVTDALACVESILTSGHGIRKVLKENYSTFIANFIANPGSDDKLHKMIQIIMHMAAALPSLQTNIYVEIYPITEKLCETFLKRQDLLKFEVLDVLISLFSTFNSHSIPSDLVPEWAMR
jgi:hypothetical protein